jgi:hypothetical protein
MRYRVDHWEEAGAMPSYGALVSAANDPGKAQLNLAADAQQSLDTRIQAAQSPEAQQAILDESVSGMQAAIHGQTLTDTQIQSGFAMGAAGALIATGVAAGTALAVVAPMAAVCFGGGYAIGQAIQALLGIHNAGAIACSNDDPTKYGSDPSDPRWITFQSYVDSNGPPPNGWQESGPHWLPYTTGSFENWARPILRVVFELGANCKPIPGAKTYRDFANGLLATWNGAAPAGSPMRKIGSVLQEHGTDADVTYGSQKQRLIYRFANDPVQWFLRGAFGAQRAVTDRATLVASMIAPPWIFSVADPPPAPAARRMISLHLGTLAARRRASDRATASKPSSGVSVVGLGLAGIGALALLKPKLLRGAMRKVGLR